MNKIWSDIYKILTKNRYTEDELRVIIRKWDNILESTTEMGQDYWSIIKSIENQLHMLQDKTVEEGNTILIKSLQALECPGKCSSNEINTLIKENNIFPLHRDKKIDKIFISHSEKDAKYARAFVDLLEDIGVQKKDIFCTSVMGCGTALGENIFDTIKKQFTEYNTLVFFLLSDNYYNSAACLNEMGAAWVLQKDYTTVLLPGYEYEQIKGTIDAGKTGFKLDDEKEKIRSRLTELKNKLEVSLELQSEDEHIWNRRLDDFLNKL